MCRHVSKRDCTIDVNDDKTYVVKGKSLVLLLISWLRLDLSYTNPRLYDSVREHNGFTQPLVVCPLLSYLSGI